MKKTRYDIETLTEALSVLIKYEDCLKNLDPFLDQETFILSHINLLMGRLKFYLYDLSPSVKQSKIDVFQVITEISFDKLEKDIMGVN